MLDKAEQVSWIKHKPSEILAIPYISRLSFLIEKIKSRNLPTTRDLSIETYLQFGVILCIRNTLLTLFYILNISFQETRQPTCISLNPYYGPDSVSYYGPSCDRKGNEDPTIKEGKENRCLRNICKLRDDTHEHNQIRQSVIKGCSCYERACGLLWRRQGNMKALRLGEVGECSRQERINDIPTKWSDTECACGALRGPTWKTWGVCDGKNQGENRHIDNALKKNWPTVVRNMCH